ncbi:hypothetical protein [Paenibacillus agricola]|nr:hypothetical protein [Paenibacillus agricola]
MAGMSETQANKWRKTRTIGKGKYMLFFGILPWGIGLAGLFTGLEWLTQQTFTPSWLYIRLAVFLVVGFFISSVRWHALEQKFHTYSTDK